MARSRKRHIQQTLEFRTHGGKRKGAGRPRKSRRRCEPHTKRPPLSRHSSVHTVLRIEDDVGTLRRRDAYHAIRLALKTVLSRRDFRVVHASLQDAHVHLVVEADDEHALARGMRAFEIAAARSLNNAISESRNRTRRGRVFADRYHARILSSPRDVRRVINYVLNNWRHHGEHSSIDTMDWHVDYFSSGPTFDGWAEPKPPLPRRYEPLPTSPPATWLLRTGWRKHGPISMYAVPGRDCDEGMGA
jgi:REP element-mobilizing transposase RayT